MGATAPDEADNINGTGAAPSAPRAVLLLQSQRLRLIVAAALVGFLGLASTVAVAWLASAVHFELVPLPQPLALLDPGFEIDALNAGWHYSENAQIGRTYRTGSPHTSEDWSPTMITALSDRASGLPGWSRFASPPHDAEESVWELAVGWPALALAGHLSSHDREPFSISERALAGVHFDPTWGGYNSWFLPFGPVWPGLLLNLAFWGLVWLAIALLPAGRSTMNRAYWRWRRLCPWCQYDMRAAVSDTCPECGRIKSERAPLLRRRWLALLALCAVALVGMETAAVIYIVRSHDPLRLHSAAGMGDVAMISELIQLGDDVNQFQPVSYWLASQTTPLMATAHAGKTDAVAALLKAGADVRLCDPRTEVDALLLAIAAGNTEAARVLIDAGGTGRTPMLMSPLCWAVFYDRQDTVKMLLHAGFDVNDPWGMPVLSAAARHDDLGLFNLLLAAGANVNARDTHGMTPLMSAVSRGRLGATELLIECGADVEARTSDGSSVLSHATGSENSAEIIRRLVAAGADVNARAANGYTVLMQAASTEDALAVQALLELGADPSVTNADGLRADQIGQYEVVEVIRRFQRQGK